MNFEWQTFMVSFVISTIGFGYFTYGRKRPAYSFMVSGIIMMLYSYFVDSFALTLGIGVVLAVVPFFVR